MIERIAAPVLMAVFLVLSVPVLLVVAVLMWPEVVRAVINALEK